MSYATDGKCHNAQRGTYGHECGKPATWIGRRTRDGHESGFCDRCKESGDERHGNDWRPVSLEERAARRAGWSKDGCYAGFYLNPERTAQISYAHWAHLCDTNAIPY